MEKYKISFPVMSRISHLVSSLTGEVRPFPFVITPDIFLPENNKE